MGHLHERYPSSNPGLRVYGYVKRSDPAGNIEAESWDFQPTLATTGLRVDLSASLAANSTWVTLWDGTVGALLVAAGAFVWGIIRGSGGTWYLEVRNAASEVFEYQMPSGGIFVFPSGSSYSSAGPAVSAINRIRARVLTGGTVTNTDGFIVR